MIERAATFAAALFAAVIFGVIPTAMMAAGVAIWHRAVRDIKNGRRLRRGPSFASS